MNPLDSFIYIGKRRVTVGSALRKQTWTIVVQDLVSRNFPLILLLVTTSSFLGCKEPLEIVSFRADPPSISRGGSARLCYSVTGAKTISIDPPIQNFANKSSDCLDVNPQETTTYILSAIADNGQTVPPGRVELKVSQSNIARFYEKRDDPNAKFPRSPVDLCYEVKNAVSLKIEPEIGTIEAKDAGCHRVNPDRDTQYTLTALDSNNVSVNEILRVEVVQPSIMAKIWFEPETIHAGQPVKLCYHVENAEEAIVFIKGHQNKAKQVKKINEAVCSPPSTDLTQSNVYILEATNIDNDKKQDSSTLTVIRPEILQFMPEQREVEYGKRTKLHYKTKNAKTTEIEFAGVKKAVIGGIFETPVMKRPMKFKLIITNEFGFPENREILVPIRPILQADVTHFPPSETIVKRNTEARLCYQATWGSDVTIQPIKSTLPTISLGAPIHKAKATQEIQCLQYKPNVTSEYLLIALGGNRRPVRKRFKITVIE